MERDDPEALYVLHRGHPLLFFIEKMSKLRIDKR